uniref:Uncharacterized protein n=1 Tax=Chenopodium quinoa TaxID=63459 RepID=A0A803L3Z1_CHEQI
MASAVQQVGGMANELSNKERAIIEEAMKEAQSVLENNMTSQDQLVLVTGVMKNSQSRALRLNKTYSWTGNFIAKPSETMSEGKAAFVHEGAAWQGNLPVVVGSKGVVIYGHYDRALPQLGWLLAWDKTAQVSGKLNKSIDHPVKHVAD